MKENILSILDTRDDTRDIIDLAIQLKHDYKQGSLEPHLKNKRLTVIFERASVRTHVSSEFAIKMIGGHSCFLGKDDVKVGKRETIQDIALALARYCDIILYRALDKENLHQLAKYAPVPVINGLDIDEHPCQILADLMTIKEKKTKTDGLNFAFIGDGDDNLTHSYMLGCPLMGINVTVVSPKSHWPKEYFVRKAEELADEMGTSFTLTDDIEAVTDQDIVATDTWVSMWYEHQRGQYLKDLQGYTVTSDIMAKAKKDAIFMHCMPITYDEEVTKDVAHGPQSVIIDEAENRLWTEMALMIKLLKKEI